MFNLDVSTEKLENLKKLLNKENISKKIIGKSADGSITILKFNNQIDFERAKQLVDVGVVAQANLIHANPFSNVSIGDTPIDWCADNGSPDGFDGLISGDAYYDGINSGVVLTNNIDGQLGSLTWQKSYNFEKNIYIRTTTYAGEGDGADGMTIFMGANTPLHSGSSDNGALGVYIDEYNDDTIKVYFNGNLANTTFYANETLDNETFRLWELLWNGTDRTLSVYMNNVLICKVDVTPWIPNGDYIGISGVTGADNNYHLCRAFRVMSGNPWLAING